MWHSNHDFVSPMIDPISVSDDEDPPRFSGVFSILNPSHRPSQTPEGDGEIVSFDSIPTSTRALLDPPELSVFYLKVDAAPLFGPVRLRFPFARFSGDFSSQFLNGGVRAIAFCVDSETYFWPFKMVLTINQKQLERPRPRHGRESAAFWLDVTNSLVMGSNSILIDARQPRGVGVFYFIVRLMMAPSDRLLAEKVELLPHATMEDWDRLVKATTEGDSDVKVAKNVVSLVCPLGLSRMSVPVRGSQCLHLGCFDLETYFRYQREAGDWKCPICGITCRSEDLRVDDCLAGALAMCPIDCEAVQIGAGREVTWK
jgi:hypothetical protein